MTLPRPMRAAIVANAPFPLVGSLTGATSGELLQLYAVGVLGLGPAAVGAAFGVAALAPLLALALTPLAPYVLACAGLLGFAGHVARRRSGRGRS